ncbi:MAG: 1-acyl-sn-glycerol-3-phosphate acyltransferase [Acidobacteriota bacterium]|jgi:1-acyl-sn-glycerol-3-phosphate acyltransferase
MHDCHLPREVLASHASPFRHPLPYMAHRFLDRLLCRSVAALAQRRILRVDGLERVHPRHDPFILALNHSQRPEAVLVPTLLIFARGGKLIHFLADWNFLMVPLVGTLFRRSGTVIVGGKSARPRILNALKPLLVPRGSPLRRAQRRLEAGRSVGVFPEGTVNRNPAELLPGQAGAAALALATGAPLIPAGIRFPGHRPGTPIREWERMEIVIGEPVLARRPPSSSRPDRGQVQELHRQLMSAISTLCGKAIHHAQGA